MRTQFGIAIIFLISFVTAMGQSERMNLSFISFPKAFDLPPVELLVGPKKTVKIKLPTHTISRPIRVPKMTEWQLGESHQDEDGNFSFKSYGKVKSSDSKDQTLIVFRSSGGPDPKYRIVCLNGDTNGFSGGSQFFHNATKLQIAGSVGNKKFVLKPNQHTLFKAKASLEKNDQKYLGIEYFYRFDDIEKFESTTWRHNDKVRYMVFFFHGKKTRQISTHMLRTYPKAPRDLPELQE